MKRNVFSRIAVMLLALCLIGTALAPALSANAATYESGYSSKQEALEAGAALNLEIAQEGMILLKNENNALPLAGTNVTVLGYASVAPAGGSAAGGDTSGGLVHLKADLYSSFADAGLVVNPTVKASYDAWLANEATNNDKTVAAADLAAEQAKWADSLTAYGDAAIIVLNQGSTVAVTMTGEAATSMSFDAEQYALVDYAAEHFETVVVLVNSSRPREIKALKDNEKVDAIVCIGEPGDNGFNAVGQILTGAVNPSGRTTDTWAVDFTKDPAYANFNKTGDPNFGYGRYTVGGELTNTYYVQYEEGIYIGYRYYETRGYEDGEDWYNDNVIYTFGYGLSYTTFDWEVTPKTASGSITAADQLTFEVKVTNTGSVAGKDVVQLYYTAPYGDATTNPTKIEKSHVVLGDFAKTKLLAPGESETLTLTIDVKDMASYDYVTDKTYVLDDGKYTVRISRNAHDHVENIDYTVAAKELVNVSVTGFTVTNQFDDVTAGYLAATDKRLSRADFAGTMPTAAPETIELTADEYATWNYVLEDKETDPWYVAEMPTQAEAESRPAEAAIKLADLVGKDYNDPMWDQLIDQLTIEEMTDLINNGGFHSVNIDYIGKPYAHDTDGPKGWTGSGTDAAHSFNQFAAEPVIAATFNKDLLYRMGVIIGEQGLWGNSTQESGMAYSYTGWYAPGMNIHRSVFDSRYTEYYSEDPVLTGTLAAYVSMGAESKGAYVSMKHFAFHNDGGGVGMGATGISGYRGAMDATSTSGMSTWLDEQTAREIYLRGYQIAVEDGKCSYAMASFNRLGKDWIGGNYGLFTNILRNEWGFEGAVVTDIVIYGSISADQMIRAGVDYLLSAGMGMGNIGTCQGYPGNTATQVAAMRSATKHILYMVAQSNAMQIPKGAKVVYTMPTVTNAEGDLEPIVIPVADQNKAYETPVLTTASLNTYGAYSELTYEVSGLPAGLALDASGKISGTPTAAGTFEVTVTAKAEGYEPASVVYSIVVNAAPPAPTTPPTQPPTQPAPTEPAPADPAPAGDALMPMYIVIACTLAACVAIFVVPGKKKD